jgi:hypothetical protein
MTIISSEIKLFQSTNGIGGAITGTEIVSATLHNLFDIVSAAESRDGDTEYRCFYIKNTNTTFTLKNATIQILSDTPSVTTVVGIGLGTSANGTPEQTVADESTPPIGVSFTEVLGTELAVGNVAPSSYASIWIRRVVDAGTAAALSDAATLRVTGETTA